MLAWLLDGQHPVMGRGLAMIDPASKRRDWLIRLRVDGRRSDARYVDYADAARRLSSPPRSTRSPSGRDMPVTGKRKTRTAAS
jgi:hypothetical protein